MRNLRQCFSIETTFDGEPVPAITALKPVANFHSSPQRNLSSDTTCNSNVCRANDHASPCAHDICGTIGGNMRNKRANTPWLGLTHHNVTTNTNCTSGRRLQYMCLQHEGALVKTDCCKATTNAPRTTHRHRRQHTHLHGGIWMANVCNPATVCGNVKLPFNDDTQTTCWPLATNTMFELPVIWTPTFGGNTTKHVTQRNTSPTSQEQIRNPVECASRCCPALILRMPPGFATLRQTT